MNSIAMTAVDSRWSGSHGIGRMTTELTGRLFPSSSYREPRWPSSPVSPFDPFVRGLELLFAPRMVFYSPGFNPPALCHRRAVFTVCDLIHLRVPGEAGALKRAYYERLVKPAVHRCFKVLTISEYSRNDILEWSGAPPDQVFNVGCGVDDSFFRPVLPWNPGYPYFLYVGARKPHKNLTRLLEAYARSRARNDVQLVLSGDADAAVTGLASSLGITNRIVFVGRIPDEQLSAYYRGATALLFPSYFEGFGLPPVEAMAGGTPVLTSTATSLPEAVGDAALTVDPFSIDAMQHAIDQLAFDSALRERLRRDGPVQARRHSWDYVAAKVGTVLEALKASVAA